jgi:ribulose-phosphate 3-epimerase
MKAGIALNPGTPLTYLEEIVDDIDLLLIMTVNPGFPAQEYVPTATKKIARARKLLRESKSNAFLEVDGGISRETIAGADTFVAGSAIFGAPDPGKEVNELRKCCMAVV